MMTPKAAPAKPQSTQPVTPAPPVVAAAPTAAPVTPSKQMSALAKLTQAWQARGLDLSKMSATPEGKSVRIVIGLDNWPTVTIGTMGGYTINELKSYADAFQAAVNGDTLFAKQRARELKATAPAPPVAPKAAAQPEQKKEAKAETPAARKRSQDAALESRLQQA